MSAARDKRTSAIGLVGGISVVAQPFSERGGKRSSTL